MLGPFEEAVAYVAQATGVGVPKRSAEQIVREAAADFASFYEKRAGSDASLEEGEILVGAIDCKGIRMVKPEGATKTVRPRKGEKPNKKRMATVAAVFGQSPRVRTPESVVESLFGTAAAADDRKQPSRPRAKRVWASLVSDKDGFIGDVAAEMARRDPRRSTAG